MSPNNKAARNRNVGMACAAILFVGAAFVLSARRADSQAEPAPSAALPPQTDFDYDYFVSQPMDTLFVMDSCYIEVRLDSQKVYLHYSNGNVRTIPCSSGNIKINKAIETPEGIYTVQSKAPIAISKQFDSTKMYFWVGFNGNIGFHGLDGKGYYRFLGKRPSSHGCLRLSKEDAEWMFNNVPLGTPVIVDNGEAARCLKLVSSLPLDAINIQDVPYIKRALNKQLQSLYRGRFYLDPSTRFYFSHSRLWWGGIAIGDKKDIPMRQVNPFFVDGRETLQPTAQ